MSNSFIRHKLTLEIFFLINIAKSIADPSIIISKSTGENEEVLGIYLNGNGKKNKFEEDEDSCFGTINPRRIETTTEEIPF